MIVRSRPRLFWVFCIVGIIAMGILSRVVHTGLAVFDKYLGDALYAALVYGIVRLFSTPAASAGTEVPVHAEACATKKAPISRTPGASAVWATAAMTAIELFQLTTIPARMLAGEHLLTRICGRLMGVEFGFLDLLAYGVGIACIYLVDSLRNKPDAFRITAGGS